MDLSGSLNHKKYVVKVDKWWWYCDEISVSTSLFYCCYFQIAWCTAWEGQAQESPLSTESSRNSFVGSITGESQPLPRHFSLGSLPNPKPGNFVILIMKRKHVLFKIPAAEFSAMLFLCDSRTSFASGRP